MLLPEEIDGLAFEVGFRGYNLREVDEFLAKLKGDLEEMLKEQEALKRKVAAAELLAKDAQDREEEFVASMQADRDATSATLESAKAEGERIIREAKNAATGIMTEVRRRAGEISAETKRASAATVDEAKGTAASIITDAKRGASAILEEARREAEKITDSAKAEAEQKLYTSRTEAENTVKAANAEARAILTEARKNSDAMNERAARSVALCNEYITEIRSTADSVCHELDIELKNAAARISLLGKRIAQMDLTPPEIDVPENDPVITAESEPEAAPEPEPIPEPEPPVIPSSKVQFYTEDEPAHPTPKPALKSVADSDDEAPSADAPIASGGYFTEEYRQVMEELFGEDVDLSGGKLPEDDDTYDYLDKMSVANAAATPATDDDDGEGAAVGDNTVTSEYTGIPGGGDDDLLDVFSTSTVDRVYKSPSDEDINNILNDF